MKKGIKKVLALKAKKLESYLIPQQLRESVYLKFLDALNEKEYLGKNSDLANAKSQGIIKSIDEHFRYKGINEIYGGHVFCLKVWYHTITKSILHTTVILNR